MTEKECIDSHKRLAEVGFSLGTMAGAVTYDQFFYKARAIAFTKCIKAPVLMLAMKYRTDDRKEFQGIDVSNSNITNSVQFKEIVHAIAKFEWDDFMRDIRFYLTEYPTVWVVDGDQYTAPI